MAMINPPGEMLIELMLQPGYHLLLEVSWGSRGTHEIRIMNRNGPLQLSLRVHNSQAPGWIKCAVSIVPNTAVLPNVGII